MLKRTSQSPISTKRKPRGVVKMCLEIACHFDLGRDLQALVPRATSSDMKQSVGSSDDASTSTPGSLGIELDNDADPDATVITVAGQAQNTGLLSQMTGWLSAWRHS